MPHPAAASRLFDVDGLDPNVGDVLAAFLEARRRHHSLMLRVVSELATPPGQAMCLRILALDGSMAQHELGTRLHLAAPTVTAMLQRMERAGTIVREADPTDQRVTRVRLTDAGRALEGEVRRVLASRFGRLLASMPDPDRRELARLLRDFADRMAEEAEASPAIAQRPDPKAEEVLA